MVLKLLPLVVGEKTTQNNKRRWKKFFIFFVLFIICVFLIHIHLARGQSERLDLPPIYIITATYPRPEQLAELTRLGYTLKHVKNLFWLVVEDSSKPTATVTQVLTRIGVPSIHLVEFHDSNATQFPRGVANRNMGLKWIRENASDGGVFYFADDDNTYDVQIFEQMRFTKKVSMFPVGLIGDLGVSSPIVENGKVTYFYDAWIGRRKYPVDMAGFTVNVKFFLASPNATMPFREGHEEDAILKSLSPFGKGKL